MIIKSDSIDFISFSDGVCDIYSEDDEGSKDNKYLNLGFSNRILGYNRAFAARAAQTKINSVIRIPQVPNINIHDTVEIRGLGKYTIELVQIIFETNPKSMDLTLRQLEMFGANS